MYGAAGVTHAERGTRAGSRRCHDQRNRQTVEASVNVCDLDEGERFWSALTGLSPTGRHGDENGDRYSSLEEPDEALWLLLQLVPRDQTSWIGGTHLDLRVDDVAVAVRRAEEIGGVTVNAPGFYPPGNAPYLEWAVMQDPFGNQFCFVKWPLASPVAVENEHSVTAEW